MQVRFRHFRFSWAWVLLALLGGVDTSAFAATPHAKLIATDDRSANSIELKIAIDPGFHAQSHTPLDPHLIPLTVTFNDVRDVVLSSAIYPEPTVENYALLGNVSVYTGTVTIRIPYGALSRPAKVSGTVRYQACNDSACFPPQKLTFDVVVGTGTATTDRATTYPATSSSTLPTTTAPSAGDAPPPATAPPQILGYSLTHDAYLLAFGGAFLVGIIFNVMPCVLPVVPLKIMGFYEVSQHDRRKSVLLGAVFSAGIILSFAFLGLLIVALHVIDWGGLFKQTWFTIAIVTLLLAMAASTFGLFTVNLPGSLYQLTPRHDTYSGNFLFGMLTAALSTPCTFGMFVGILTWAVKQPAAIGMLLFVTVGIGMATPYLVLSAIPEVARGLPRTGPWAETVKQLMAFLLLGTAVYFAQPLLGHSVSQSAMWWLIYGVAAAAAIFLVVRTLQVAVTTTGRIIGFTIALLVAVPTLFVTRGLAAQPFEWTPYSAQTLAAARAANRPVLIDFTATWCGNCHYLEGFVLHDRRVVDAVLRDNVLMLQADVSNGTESGQKLLENLNPIGSVPVTAIYLPGVDQPKVLKDIYSADDLITILK